MTARSRSAGFTLLEVLVALVIAGLALSVLFQGTAAGLATTQVAGRYEEALERARSHVAALAAAGALAPVDETGDDGGGYRWRHRVAVVASETPGGPGPSGPRAPTVALYAVSVAITWTAEGGRQRSVALDTERLGLAARSGP